VSNDVAPAGSVLAIAVIAAATTPIFRKHFRTFAASAGSGICIGLQLNARERFSIFIGVVERRRLGFSRRRSGVAQAMIKPSKVTIRPHGETVAKPVNQAFQSVTWRRRDNQSLACLQSLETPSHLMMWR
jgi:hypothetical protein